MNEIQSFTSNLAIVSCCRSKKSQYIQKNSDSSFCVISSKSAKNLNTQEIGELAAGYFAQLTKNKELALDTKADYYIKLGQALEQYNQRVRQSKKCIYRFLAFLGIKSSPEKKIELLSQDILGKAKLIAERSKRLDQIIKEQTAKEKSLLNGDETLLTLFNLKVLDSLDFEIYDQRFSFTANNERSVNTFEATESVIRDLDAFKIVLKDEKSQKLVQEAIQKLQFNLRINGLVSHAVSIFQEDWLKYKISSKDQLQNFMLIEEIAEEILLKMKQLSLASSSMIFGGGYGCASKANNIVVGGHHVLYEIQQQPNGLYTFAMTNTGDGAKFVGNEVESKLQDLAKAQEEQKLLLKQEKYDGYARADKIVNLIQLKLGITKLMQTTKLVEVIYTDLTEQEFIKSFLFDLISFLIIGAENMEVVNQFINASLFHPMQPNIIEGRPYNKQQKGSCTIKPLFKWLHGKFGPQLYQQFSIFRIDQDLASINKLKPGNELVGKLKQVNPKTKKEEITEYRGQELIQFMKAQGIIIRERKEKKLASLT